MEKWEELETYVVRYFNKRWPGLHKTNRSGGVSGDGDCRSSVLDKRNPSPFPIHIDCKFKSNKSISVTLNEFKKIEQQAKTWAGYKTPVIVRQIVTGQRYAILPFDDFADMVMELDKLREHNNAEKESK